MYKIKQWFRKIGKFEKIILTFFITILIFVFFIVLINIIISFFYILINSNSINWNNFLITFAKNICLKISTIIVTIITSILIILFIYKKWKKFDKFIYKQNKKIKKIEKEFNKIPENNLIKLNNNIGLIKSNLIKHTLLIGTKNSEKTITLLIIIKELIKKFCETTIIIDNKGDVNLINKIKKINPNAFVWTINGNLSYNPFSNKNKIILANKTMYFFDSLEQNYKNTIYNYLLLLFDTLLKNNIDINFDNLIKYFPIKKLEKLINFNNKKNISLSNFEEKKINELCNQLNIYNVQLNSNFGNKNSLLESINNHKIILFSINSFIYPKLANIIEKIIIQDLKELTDLKLVNKKINIIFNEINVFINENIINLVNKSLGINYQCFFSFQKINDLKINNINLINDVFNKINSIICHNIKDNNTAEYIANILSINKVEEITKKNDFKINNNKTKINNYLDNKFIIYPNDLKTLKIGECYFKTVLPSEQIFLKKIKITSVY